MENATEEMKQEKKLHCCVECKDSNDKTRDQMESLRNEATTVKVGEKEIPISSAESLYFAPYRENEFLMRLLTSQIDFNTQHIDYSQLQEAIKQIGGLKDRSIEFSG